MKLELNIGALSPSISEQVKEQLNYTDGDIEYFSELGTSIVDLYINDIITSSEKTKACNRLMKKITKHLNSLKK